MCFFSTLRSPKSTTRTARFLDEKYGADGKSKHRLDWKQSSLWDYWIEGCLSNSSTRFRKFFRITLSHFDEIYQTAARQSGFLVYQTASRQSGCLVYLVYQAAADSGKFRLNPAEPLFACAFPEIPPGKHGDQLPKVCPLCLRIGVCLLLLPTGEPYSSLETSFQISKTVLLKFSDSSSSGS